MLIDARRGHYNWTMWHCELCRNIANTVLWVETDYAQYGQYLASSYGTITVVQARTIIAYPEQRLILVNPVDDNSDHEVFTYDADSLVRVR